MNFKHIIIGFLFATLSLTGSELIAQAGNKGNNSEPPKQGAWEKKDANGNIVYQGFFNNNVPEGEFIYFDSTGRVTAKVIFSEKGTKAYTTMFKRNQKVSEGLFINEKKDGEWKYFNADSIVIAEENYVKGVPHGKWKTYYANGALLEEITYVNGKKEGSWMQYFYDGPVKTKATYHNDKLEGLATFFHPNGRVFISGPYKGNLKDGVWMHMNDKGVAEKKETWSAGFMTSEEYFDKKLERMVKEEK